MDVPARRRRPSGEHDLEVAGPVAQRREAACRRGRGSSMHPAGDADRSRRCGVSGGEVGGAARGPRRRCRCAGSRPGTGRCRPPGSGPACPAGPASAPGTLAAARAGASGGAVGGVRRSASAAARRVRPAARRSGVAGRCPGTATKPSAMADGEADPGQLAALAEAQEARLPLGLVLGVGPVQRLELPPAGEEQQQLAATAAGPARRRSGRPPRRPRGTPRSSARPGRRRAAARPRISSATMNSMTPLSACAVAAHQVQREAVRAPRAERQQRAWPGRRSSSASTSTQRAVGRVAEPAQRHREAALGLGVAPGGRPARRRSRISSSGMSACRRTRAV